MTLNPELNRNFWLELSLERLIAMPVILGLLFWVATLTGDTGAIARGSLMMFHLVVLLWGTRRAADAVAGEVRSGTWDDQRMSPISAWSMAWGKLVGATVYSWYGGGICLAVFLGANIHQGRVAELGSAIGILSLVAAMVLTGLLGQAVSLAASLAFLQKRRLERALPVTFCQLVGLAVAYGAAYAVFWEFFVTAAISPANQSSVSWFGVPVGFWPFVLLSLAAFLAWALLGLYRMMQAELQYRTRPWGWLGFTTFMMIYAAGLLHDEVSASRTSGLIRLATPFLIAAAGVYLIFFLEPKNTVQLRKGLAALRDRAWPMVWRLTPNWILSMFLLWAVGLLQILTAHSEASRLPDPVQWLGISIGEISTTWVLAAMLFVGRDMLMLLYLNLSRRKGKPDTTGFIYLLVLYGLLPPLLTLVAGQSLLPAVVPYPTDKVVSALGPVALQVAALGYICRRALSRQRPELPSGDTRTQNRETP